jgi:putative polyketide hydroxylase
MIERTTPVLIVGAGPAGLTAAIALARAGVDCTVIERRSQLFTHPRATVVSTRTMELMRSWGLEQEVRAGGVAVDWLMWLCETLARAGDGVGIEVGLPSRRQASVVSPTAPECVPQDHLERVLLDHLRALPCARIEFGTELMGLESRPDTVRATVRTANGEHHELDARFLIAADGARSVVRASLEIPMDGSEDVLVAVRALLRAPLWDIVGEHRYGIYAVTDPAAEGVFLPAGPDDRWLYGYFVERDAPLPAPADYAERVRASAGVAELDVRVEQIASFSSAAQVAERFRHDNVFLIGDAAHRVTPRGEPA